MVKEDRSTWKAKYTMRLTQYLDEYPKVFVVGADNVGSRQMQKIRVSLRGHAVLMMGKNTMMRKTIRGQTSRNANLEKLLTHVYENVGFVFTKEDLSSIRDKLLENKVAAPARAGAIAPVDVTIPAQVTSLGPEKTSFFQALQIPTKITRGTIEIINDVHLIKVGEKVGASEAALLNMLNISPFSYGLIIRQVYDSGSCFEPAILDIKPADLRAKFSQGIQRLAAFSLGINYPNQVSAPHLVLGGFKRLLALAANTDIEFEQAKTLKEFLKDPSKFAAAAAPTASTSAPAASGGGKAPAEQKPAKPAEPESDDEDMGGLDIFG
jgi:large subunit ribosomal protein LP0